MYNIQSAAKFFEHLRSSVSQNSYLMQFFEINIEQVMIFRLYTVYKKHEMIKIGSQTREKSQVLSQVLELFYCWLYVTIPAFVLRRITFYSQLDTKAEWNLTASRILLISINLQLSTAMVNEIWFKTHDKCFLLIG